MLHLENFTKRFGDVTAVRGVNFDINPGEIFALIGPNSSGKTTIVKTVAGLLHPDGGMITVGNFNTKRHPIESKRLVGYIPDEPAAWSGMTGEELLHFVGALYGMSAPLRAERIRELLPLFALEGIAQDYFDNYSRGNKQKFSILAALLHEPKLLLIDEPIVGLDPESAAKAKTLFSQFARDGGAVLLVTHTLPVAQSVADRIGVLVGGELRASGTLAELRTFAGKGATATLEAVYTAIAKMPRGT